MTATPPEANTEYSRAHRASREVSGGGVEPPRTVFGVARIAFPVTGLLGVVALIVAELTPLLHVRVAAGSAPVKTVLTGAHHGYALLPVAALAVVLTLVALAQESRPALVALGALGLIALAIALVGDLPDARASGLIGSSATRFVQARSSPAVGLYLETLGAVLLLLASGLGLLLLGPGEGSRGRLRWFVS